MTQEEFEKVRKVYEPILIINTALALLRDYQETCVRVMKREGWQSGINRGEMIECGRKYWKFRELIGRSDVKQTSGEMVEDFL